MREHTKTIGDRSTLAIMCALRAQGYDLLVPFGENTRYDLVIDDGERLAKVQCKTGRVHAGAISFRVCSSYAHHPNPKVRFRPYGDEIDYFAVYCPDNGGVYLVPIGDLPNRFAALLRLEPTRNSQRQGVRFAAPYEIGRIPLIIGEPGGRAGGSGSSA
jgi:hypothetical protein